MVLRLSYFVQSACGQTQLVTWAGWLLCRFICLSHSESRQPWSSMRFGRSTARPRCSPHALHSPQARSGTCIALLSPLPITLSCSSPSRQVHQTEQQKETRKERGNKESSSLLLVCCLPTAHSPHGLFPQLLCVVCHGNVVVSLQSQLRLELGEMALARESKQEEVTMMQHILSKVNPANGLLHSLCKSLGCCCAAVCLLCRDRAPSVLYCLLLSSLVFSYLPCDATIATLPWQGSPRVQEKAAQEAVSLRTNASNGRKSLKRFEKVGVAV